MQNLRQIKMRIKSVENTRKITNAMEMVSAAKLHNIKSLYYRMKDYQIALEDLMDGVDLSVISPYNPFALSSPPPKRAALCVITSDAGLCASYNLAIIQTVKEYMRNNGTSAIDIISIGKEGEAAFGRLGYNIKHAFPGMYGKYSNDAADKILILIKELFASGKYHRIDIAYTNFKASLRHIPVIETLLPFNLQKSAKNDLCSSFAPAVDVAVEIANIYIKFKIRLLLLESFTAEHSSRMLIMKTATENANELLETLTLSYNKARQFAITREVLEIAMSAEALKG